MNRKSKLKSKVIKKVWVNKKNYKFLDFDFKVINLPEDYKKSRWSFNFDIEVYNCGVLILKLNVWEGLEKIDERFSFKVNYFNPQTDNDCFSINHIIAVCSESVPQKKKNKDMGNAEVFKNQFVFRKKKSYYSHTRLWARGDIEMENYDKSLSYEFATDEYINYIKNIFEIKRIQRRTIKKNFKSYLDKILISNSLK